MTIILFTWLALLNLASAETFRDVCLSMGGNVRGTGCFCPISRAYFNPMSVRCEMEALRALGFKNACARAGGNVMGTKCVCPKTSSSIDPDSDDCRDKVMDKMAMQIFQSKCHKAGGQFRGIGCFCPMMEAYIDPTSQVCFEKGLGQLFEVGPVSPLECAPSAVKGDFVYVPPGRGAKWCKKPADFLCDSKFNPFVDKLRENEKGFFKLYEEAKKDPEVMRFGQGKLEGKSTFKECSDLSPGDQAACKRKVEGVFHRLLYTDDRKEKTRALFKRAQASVLQFLEEEEKKERLRPIIDGPQGGYSKSLARSVNLQKMKKVIRETELFFGSEESSYNAFYRDTLPESKKKWHSRLTGKFFTSSVLVDGLIMNVDVSPETLYQTLLHELGHAISVGNTDFREDGNYTGNPFQETLKCLKEESSVGAKEGDYKCFKKKAASARGSEKKVLDWTAERIKENPDINQLPDGAEPVECQMGQLNEAFADWVSIEAYALEKRTRFESVIASDLSSEERLKAMPELLSLSALHCANYGGETDVSRFDSHSTNKDRLNGIFMSHPLINAAFGCSSEDVVSFESKPPRQGKRLYCGRD